MWSGIPGGSGFFIMLEAGVVVCYRCQLDHSGTPAVPGKHSEVHAHYCRHLPHCYHCLDHLCAPPQQAAPGMPSSTAAPFPWSICNVLSQAVMSFGLRGNRAVCSFL